MKNHPLDRRPVSQLIQAVLLTLCLTLTSLTQADNQTWDGDTDGVWATLTNWVGDAGVVPGTGDTATFNSAGGTVDIIDLGAGVTLNTLLFDTASVAAYTIGSGAVGSQTLTLDDNGIIQLNAAVINDQIVAANLAIINASLINNSANSLTVTGDIAANTTGGPAILTVDGSGAINISGAISENVANPLTLTKSGSGTLTLSGDNTYTGLTDLQAGVLTLSGNNTGNGGLTMAAATTLNFNNAGALGTGTFTINGGTLDNTSGGALVNSNNNAQTWAGDFAFTGSNNLDLGAGAVTLSATQQVTVGAGNLTVGGVIGGASFGISKAGAGSLTLSGNNTFTGPVTVSDGTLTLSGSNAYTGATTVDGGTLNVVPSALANTSAVSIGTTSNGILSFATDGVGAVVTLASNTNLTLGGGSSSGELIFELGANTAASDAIAFTGSGALTVGAGGGLISALNLGTMTATSYNIITGPNNIVNPGNLDLGSLPGGFTYSLDTASDLTKVTLISTAAAGGDLWWRGGSATGANTSWSTLAGGDSNWSTTANGTTEAGFTPGASNTVNFSGMTSANYTTTLDNFYSVTGINILTGGGAVTISTGTTGSLTVGSGGIDVQTGAPTVTTINAPVILGASQDWTVTDGGSSLIVRGDISESSVSNLTKNGAGTLTLTGTNTYSGTTTISAGTLKVGNGGASGSLGTGAVTNNAALIVDRTGTLTVANVISGSGTLTKSSTGTLLLSGANTFTGGVTLGGGNNANNLTQIGVDSVGTVGAITSSALGTGTVTVLGGRLSSDSTAARTVLNAIEVGSGGFNIGDGTNNGLLTFDGGINLDITRSIRMSSSAIFNGVVTGGIISKTGGGVLTLAGNNTNGGIRAEGGVTFITNAGALGASNWLSGTNSVLRIGDGLTITDNLVIRAAGSNKVLQLEPGGGNSASYNGTITLQETTSNNFDISAGGAGTNNDPTQVFTIGGQITGNSFGASANALDIIGDGVVVLTNATNDFQGNISLRNGNGSTLRVTNDGALSSAQIRLDQSNTIFEIVDGITVDNSIVVTNRNGTKTIRIYNSDGSVAESATFSGTISTAETGTGVFNIQVADDLDSLTVSGVISGAGTVQSAGDGTLHLTNANTFSGIFQLGDGTSSVVDLDGDGNMQGIVVASTDTSLGLGSINSIGGQLRAASGGLTFANDIDVEGGGLRLGGSNSYELSGAIGIKGGTGIGNYGLDGTTITLSGDIDLAASGAGQTITLQGSNGKNNGEFILSGVISDGAFVAGINIDTTFDEGDITLSGANTYTGQTRVQSGTLHISAEENLGGNPAAFDADNVRIDAAGTLNATETFIINDTNRGVTINGGTIDVDDTKVLTIDNVVAGTSLNKVGTGVLELSAANTFSGGLNVNVGTVRAGTGANAAAFGPSATAVVTVASSANVELNDQAITIGTLAGAGTVENSGAAAGVLSFQVIDSFTGTLQDGTGGTLGLTKVGAGTTTLSTNNTYTGATTVSVGTLNIGGTNTSVVTVADGANLGGEGSTTGEIIFLGSSSLFVDASTDAELHTDANLTASGGAASIMVDFGSTTGAGLIDVISYGGTFGDGTGVFTLASGTSGRAGAGIFTDTGMGTNGIIQVDLGYVDNTWTGTTDSVWEIDGAKANWTGGASDTLWKDGDNAIFQDAGVTNFDPTLASNISANDVTFTNTVNAYTVGGATAAEILTVNGTLTANNTAAVDISAGLTGGASGLNIDGTGDLTLSGVISGSNGLIKAGLGTTTVTGVPTFTGDATVNEGTLVFVDAAITDSRRYGYIALDATLEFDYSSGNPAIVDFDITGAGTFKKTGSGTISLTSSGASVAMDSDALFHVAEGTWTFGAGSAGNWTTNLSDMLIDSGTTFEGRGTAIFIDALNGAGTLGIGGPSTSGLPAGHGIGVRIGVDDGGGTFSGIIKNTDSSGQAFTLEKVGSGTQILSGNNTYTGATTITGSGTLQIGNAGTTGTIGNNSDVSVASGSTLAFNRTNTYTYGGVISGDGAVSINSGTVALSGASTHTGTITVASGAALGGEGSTTGDVFFNAGGLLAVDGSNGTTAFGANGDFDTSAGLGVRVDTAPTAPGPFTVVDYGTWTNTAGIADLSVAAGGFQASGRGAGATFTDTSTSITLDLGYLNNTWQGTDGANPTLWDIGTTGNWSNTTDALFYNGDFVTFDDTATTKNVVITGANVAPTSVIFSNTTGNDYTLGSAGSETLSTAHGIQFNGTGDVTINSVITGTGGLTQSGTGTTTLTAKSTYLGAVAVNAGTLILDNQALNGSTAADNTATIAIDATLEFRTANGDRSISTFDHGGDGTFKKTGGSKFTQTSSASDITYSATGLVHVAEGVYEFGGATPGNWSSNLGSMQIDSGATFEGRATEIFIDALDGAGTFGIGGKSATGTGVALTIGVSNGGGTFSGAIKNTTDYGTGYVGAPFSLEKVGTGTQTLNGNNTYTGATTISAGQLNIGGTNVSSITVGTGAGSGANLGGEGSTTGNITFTESTHTLEIDAGTAAALGTTGTGVTDWTAATGKITVNVAGSGPGAITVLTYGAGINGSLLTDLSLGTHLVSGRTAGTFVDDFAGNITIDLGFLNASWNGDNVTNPTFWDVATTDNWGTTDTFFRNGDDVTFDETASNFTPTLQSNITAGKVTFSSDSTAYILNGGGQTLTVTTGLLIEDAGDVTINAAIDGTGDLTNTSSGTATLDGNITLDGGLTISGTGNTNIGGDIDGTGGLAKSGAGTTTLTGTNTYTGDTTVSAGTLLVSGDNSGATGAVTVSGGTLTLGADNVISDSSVVTQTAGTINLNGKTETIHSIVATGGFFGLRGGTLTLLNDSTFSNEIQIWENDSFLRIAAGKTLTHSAGKITQLSDNETLTYDVGTGGLADIRVEINADGNGAVDKLGTGTLRLTFDDSGFGGGTRIENGILEFNSIANIGIHSSLGDADTLDVLQIGSTDGTTGATLRMIETHATKNTSDRAVQLGAAGATIDVEEAGQTLTLTGVVSNVSTAAALTKAGAGTLVLGGANTYSGNTTVAAGTLRAGSATAFGSSTTSAMTVNAGATLQLDGNDNSIASLSGAGTVENANAIATAATLTTGGDNTDTTFSGVIQDGTGGGALALTKLGTGTQTLTGTNTYTGATNITDGTLLIDGSTGAGSSVNVLSGGTLGGSGTINGATTIQSGGNHTAGTIGTNTAATQALNSTLTYNDGATVTWDLISNANNGDGASGNFDQFNLTTGGDLLAFGGNLNFDIDFGSSVDFEDNFWNSQLNEWKVWDTGVVDAAPGSFTITNSANPSFNGAFVLQSGNAYGAADTTGIWLVQTSVIPEPSTYAIFGLGLALFGWTARRRRKQASAVVSD